MIQTRPPAVSGTFYPALPGRLRADVKRYLDSANVTARTAAAIMAPHAGYMYSGAIAGAAFASVQIPGRCVLLGPSHSADAFGRETGSVLLDTPYRTPLGEVAVDSELGRELLEAAGGVLREDPERHAGEHSLEVLLPFLQVLNSGVRVVPILLDGCDWARVKDVAHAIARCVHGRDDVLLVASSDMHHYEPAPITIDKDTLALDRVIVLDGEGLLQATEEHHISMCGRVAVACTLEAARAAGKRVGEVVGYSHSGLVDGRNDRVVGYAAALIGIA